MVQLLRLLVILSGGSIYKTINRVCSVYKKVRIYGGGVW